MAIPPAVSKVIAARSSAKTHLVALLFARASLERGADLATALALLDEAISAAGDR